MPSRTILRAARSARLESDERRQGAPGCRRRRRHRGDSRADSRRSQLSRPWSGSAPRRRIVKHNMNARWVNDTGVRDLYAATAPGRLNGAGQTAAVADTGVNYKLDLNGRAHINFRDCDAAGVCKEAIYTQTAPGNTPAAMESIQNNNTGHRKMVAYFDLGNAGPNMFDESSHGTHTGRLRRRRQAAVRHLAERRRHGAGREARPPEHRHDERRPRRPPGRRVQHVPPGLPAAEPGRRPDESGHRATTRTTSRTRTRAPTTTRGGRSRASSTTAPHALRPLRLGPRGHGHRRLRRQRRAGRVHDLDAVDRQERHVERRVRERAPADGLDRLDGCVLVARPDPRRPLRRRPRHPRSDRRLVQGRHRRRRAHRSGHVDVRAGPHRPLDARAPVLLRRLRPRRRQGRSRAARQTSRAATTRARRS